MVEMGGREDCGDVEVGDTVKMRGQEDGRYMVEMRGQEDGGQVEGGDMVKMGGQEYGGKGKVDTRWK